ncbi:interleukin-12 receptor subunit beta-1 [Sorex araneus]|uniref:interleukin-12 receptor subunit beta-1 n=1 Tax=Sorex araneus TaxID=42254 RepID=UPI0003314A33|nr:interleukin-12 receptor subunit beta-1 [Sorex araneus]
MGQSAAVLVSLPVLLLLPPRQGAEPKLQCEAAQCRFVPEACPPRECCFRALPYAEDSGSPWDLTPGPRNLSCYRLPDGHYECSWGYEGPREGVSHFLHCCFGPQRCCYFAVGAATSFQFSDQDEVPVRRTVSFWVESRGAGGLQRSPPLNVTLNRMVKYDPPPGNIKVSRRHGQLLMEWEAPEDQGDAQVQFRQRLAGGSWVLGDCAQQGGGHQDTMHESCLWPLEAGVVREFQFRRRWGRGDPRVPWSSWSSSVCSPLEPPALPQLNISLGPLGPDGRRQLILDGQLPQPALPDGCRGEGTYHVHLQMLSCTCKPKATAIQALHLGRSFDISGAAYSLTVAPEDGSSPNQSWHIPAQAHTGAAGTAQGSPGWPDRTPGTTYCIEWEPQSPEGRNTSCTLMTPQAANHSWTPMAGDDGCITILASARPENLATWSTVLSTFHFGGNASGAGSPQLVLVRNVTSRSASVSWTPPALGACSGLLRGYAVRYQDEARDSGAAEHSVGPAQTHAHLRGLRPGRPYAVQVRAQLTQGPGTWSPSICFHTDDERSALSTFLPSAGSFAIVFLLGVLGYLGLSRAARCLCPPLPVPCASSAVQFPDGQWKQAWFWVSPADFLEEASLQEALAVNTSWEEDEEASLDIPGHLHQKLEPSQGAPEPSRDVELLAEDGGPEPGPYRHSPQRRQAALQLTGLALCTPPRPHPPDSQNRLFWF